MIIYSNTKLGFKNDVENNYIADIISNAFKSKNFSHNNESEYRSWANSLLYMNNVLNDNEISDDVKIAIEYQIPLTSKRVDFLIAGTDLESNNNVVVVELKQWEKCEATSRQDIVKTYVGAANRSVTHPSYQAYSYAKIIENFNEDVRNDNISLRPCAFLHNYKEEYRSEIEHDLYSEAISLAPVFLSKDITKLRNFIKSFVIRKSNVDLLLKIDNGKLKPAKALQDSLASM
ncbi:MAG: hypothetical protein ACRC5M_06390, partial [Anaeroplasmataceae bacterium]